MDFGSKRKKHTYIETSLGFLEESKFITSPCRGVSRWGSRRLAWVLCGRAGWSRGTVAPEEEREHRVRAAVLRPGQGIAAGLAATDSCPLQGQSTLGCYGGESGVSAPWVLESGISPRDDRRRGAEPPCFAVCNALAKSLQAASSGHVTGRPVLPRLVPVPELEGWKQVTEHIKAAAQASLETSGRSRGSPKPRVCPAPSPEH